MGARMVTVKEKLEPLEVIDRTVNAAELIVSMDHGLDEYVIPAENFEQLQQLLEQLQGK